MNPRTIISTAFWTCWAVIFDNYLHRSIVFVCVVLVRCSLMSSPNASCDSKKTCVYHHNWMDLGTSRGYFRGLEINSSANLTSYSIISHALQDSPPFRSQSPMVFNLLLCTVCKELTGVVCWVASIDSTGNASCNAKKAANNHTYGLYFSWCRNHPGWCQCVVSRTNSGFNPKSIHATLESSRRNILRSKWKYSWSASA